MSKYTTELRYVCEGLAYDPDDPEAPVPESVGYNQIANVIFLSRAKIFDFYYPIFDNEYKGILETKILRHFYTRELCEETFGLWKLRLCDRLNIIMPYYNQLYESELLKFNPFYDVDLTKSHQGTRDNREQTLSETHNDKNKINIVNKNEETTNDNVRDITRVDNMNKDIARSEDVDTATKDSSVEVNSTDSKTSTNEASGSVTDRNIVENEDTNSWDKYSDTPQGSVSRIDLENNAYLTNARNIDESDDKTTADTTNTNTVNDSVERTESANAINSERNTDVNKQTDGSENVKTTQIGNENRSDSGNGTSESVETGNSLENSTGVTEGLNTVNSIDSYIKTVVGKQGSASYSSLLIEFRKTFLNIDAMILDELSDLFFGLW